MIRTFTTVTAAVLSLAVASVASAQELSYKVLATSKTSSMQKEMQEAGALGYRFVAVMGGETEMGGKEVVVLLERDKDSDLTYEYRLLATTKTSTLQKELDEIGDNGYAMVGQTVFESQFGGKEAAAILQRASNAKRNRYRVSTDCDAEDLDAREGVEGGGRSRLRGRQHDAGQDRLGGQELVVITRRQK